MAAFKEGEVVRVVEEADDIVRVTVTVDGSEIAAVGYPFMLGRVRPGDRVVVNTTGLDLGLGTGGAGFILWNLDGPAPPGPREGHIVKLRYTPWQTEVASVEAQESPHHARLETVESIEGMPVVTASLHSQVAAIAAGIKAAESGARVGYLMTDGGALPLAWSNLVRELRRAELIDVSCTCGHAFGGDLEAVNIFSGLAALRAVAEVDVAIVAMGPGVVGTASALGFTGMEQGQALDAVAALGGTGVAALRISFVDPRERHTGVSHHSLTALRLAARESTTVVVPELPDDQRAVVEKQLEQARLSERHRIVTASGSAGLTLLEEREVHPTSMNRSVHQVPELFLAGAAAGHHAVSVGGATT